MCCIQIGIASTLQQSVHKYILNMVSEPVLRAEHMPGKFTVQFRLPNWTFALVYTIKTCPMECLKVI